MLITLCLYDRRGPGCTAAVIIVATVSS